MKFLEGGEVDFQVSLSAEGVGTTLENLKTAVANENEEHGTLYPDYARQARREGFEPVALVLEAIIEAEKYHAKRYRTLALNLEAGRVFKREEAVWWRCQNCGYITKSQEAPVACVACAHPQAHFEILVEED
jgi:rubrerythrin